MRYFNVVVITLLLYVVTTIGQHVNHPPQFLPDGGMDNFSLREDTPIGSTVYRLQGRDPEGTDVTFSISGDLFSIDRESGVVTLVKPLDREVQAIVEVIITVTDERIYGQEPNTVPRRQEIPIIDVNDNLPTYHGTPYILSVKESVSPGATLFSGVKITDDDVDQNAQIVLSCLVELTPEACEMFDVREARMNEGEYVGIISLRKPLDYETDTHYTLAIVAEDSGGAVRQSSTTSVSITVLDVQDQPPKFLNAPYSATVREASPQGTKVFELFARDGDLGEPRELTVTVEGDDAGYFTIQNVKVDLQGTLSATLTTSHIPLDREDPIIINNGGLYTFNIRASERGAGGESMIAPVTIVVTDVDDQRPVFSSDYVSVSVSEDLADGTPLPGLDLVVSDGDIGDNARFSLALEDIFGSKGVFSVFPETAVGRTPVIIKVADSSRLDFEDPAASKFVFKVVVSEAGKVVSAAVINVTVTDANDNPPTFRYPSYRYYVSEAAESGTHITVLLANDSDSGMFGQITYSLKGFGAEKFVVSSKRGELTVGSCGVINTCLDYERQTSYSLTYSAMDGGGKITSVNIFIDVLDENDNSPIFLQREYRRTVDEGATHFDPPLFVKATDGDGDQQGGGQVFYTLIEGNTEDDAFFLEPVSGELIIQRPLTHIDTPTAFYTLSIRATDAGNPTRDSDVRVYVTVGRDNNRPPRFTQQEYRANIAEDAASGLSVVQVTARDPDGDDGEVFYLVTTGARDSFTMNETTGIISVSPGALLDRDIMETYQLVVVAVDGGADTQQSTTAAVIITLLDVNNKPPIFKQDSYVRYISERLPVDESVVTVMATDPDSTSNLHYYIIQPTIARDKTGVTLGPSSPYRYQEVFKVKASTGEVTVSGRLDHNEAAIIILTILCTDNNTASGKSTQNDTTEVSIYIQAFSDKNPIFAPPWTPARPFLEVKLKEEQELGKPLFSVAAKDPVTGQPVRRYEKVSGSDVQNMFSVSPITGQVSLNSRLDYEASDTKTSSLQVLAVAGDRSSEATVTVNIIDVNDNSPQFSENEYHGRLSEDARWPKSVLSVSASDSDTQEFGVVSYTLGGEGGILFVINKTTGEILVARGAELDRETTPTITLDVTAADTPSGGVTQRKTTVIVKLELTDVNDESPVWSEGGSYTMVVAENTAVGSAVTHLLATDPDLGVNGLVRYQLPEPQGEIDGLFSIDPESGVLSVRSPLSGKGRTAPYEVKVRAVDQGTPQQFSESIVTLFIGDVSTNDGVPAFITPSPNQGANVIENSKVGTAVFQVRAVDPDDPDTPNGKIVYSFLDDGWDEGAFTIDPSSGVIKSRRVLDRETRDQYVVVVVAQDLGRPPQLTSRVLVINITDADDTDPVFMKQPGEEMVIMEVEEEAAVGTRVGYLSASDHDIGNNALIDYTITHSDNDGLFGINRTLDNRGMIYVRNRIDREKVNSVKLTISCSKYGRRLPSKAPYTPGDLSQIQVMIQVQDLDDNRPEFSDATPTAGVRVDAPLQTEVLRIKAHDKDPTSLPIRYTLHNISFSHVEDTVQLLPSDNVNVTEVFLLEKATGVLRTNAPLTRFAHGIFTAYVAASSTTTERPVFAKTTIYVLRDTDLLRFVFDVTPGEVRHQLDKFTKEIEDVMPVTADLNIYDTAYYTDTEGAIDFSSTGSCFQVVGRSMEDSEILLDSGKNNKLKDIFFKYSVKRVERCVPRRASRAAADWVEIWVLVIGVVIGVGAAIAACSVCCLYSQYKHRIRRHQQHLRLLDSPQQPAGPPPGSIIMLPPGPPQPNGPPPQLAGPPPLTGPPHLAGPHPHLHPPGAHHLGPPPPHHGPDGRSYEWQERGLPLDNVSYRSGPQ